MTQKQTKFWTPGARCAFRLIAGVAALSATALTAQVTQRPNYPTFGAPQQQLQLLPIPVTQPITANGTVVEDVVARVNDQIITRSEYEQALKGLKEDALRQGATQDQLDAEQKNLLRDMIDQQILLARGKELGITGDAEMTRRLDDIRKQNHLDSMEALEKAAATQGVSFEDFKQNIRNQAIQQKVVNQEVGSHLNITHAEEEAYYKAHASEFTVPEQIHLSEILIPTAEKATDAELAAAKAKAEAAEQKLKEGTGFSELAKTVSSGPTAAAGGDLGDFQRGQLGDVLEKATFSLPVGSFTEPIRTRQGYVILRVDKRQEAGIPPLDKVENRVQEGVYMQGLQPALRAFLTKARTDLYVDVRPGFIDTGAVAKKGKDVFTAYKAPAPKKKTVKHQRLEAQKAAAVQADLSAARAKLAAKNAERAAAAQGSSRKSARNAAAAYKPVKVKREKVRFGQAPRNSLPAGKLPATEINNGVLAGQAPGTAMALTASTTTISSDGEAVPDNGDPMAIQAEKPRRKTRITELQHETDTKRLEKKLKKVVVKASDRPVAATPQMSADEKQQAAPLGLNGDTHIQPKKPVDPNAPKERIQRQPLQPVDTTPQPAPTANPALIATPGSTKTPIVVPATTTADPNAPVTAPAPK